MRDRAVASRREQVSSGKEQMAMEKHRQLIESMLNKGRIIAATKIQRQCVLTCIVYQNTNRHICVFSAVHVNATGA